MRILRVLLAVFVAIALGLYLNNASWLAPAPDGEPKLYAHRGVHQPYERAGLTNDTCTAERMLPPAHDYLENTIASMQAAFAYGADRVEMDIYRTADGDWAVFHDYGLACRTDGEGRIRDHTMATLRTLDIGHGYTADDGQTFPFRGRFVGAMPSLADVLTRFPDGAFELHAKGATAEGADALWAYLQQIDDVNVSRLTVFALPEFDARWSALDTGVPVIGKHRAAACVQSYLLTGWTGRLPAACESGIVVPQDVAWLFWGWPNRLQQRFADTPVGVMLIGPALKEDGSRAIDSLEELARVPDSFAGWIYTNRIELIGPAVEARAGTETASGPSR